MEGTLIALLLIVVGLFLMFGTSKKEIVKEPEQCLHDWHELQDQEGNAMGLICNNCKFVAGGV